MPCHTAITQHYTGDIGRMMIVCLWLPVCLGHVAFMLPLLHENTKPRTGSGEDACTRVSGDISTTCMYNVYMCTHNICYMLCYIIYLCHIGMYMYVYIYIYIYVYTLYIYIYILCSVCFVVDHIPSPCLNYLMSHVRYT